MDIYSKELVERLQVHFKDIYNKDVDNDTAQMYLESFATLFLVFKK